MNEIMKMNNQIMNMYLNMNKHHKFNNIMNTNQNMNDIKNMNLNQNPSIHPSNMNLNQNMNDVMNVHQTIIYESKYESCY